MARAGQHKSHITNDALAIAKLRLLAANLCARHGSFTIDDIRTYADLRGIRLKHANSWGRVTSGRGFTDVYQRCGNTPSSLPSRRGGSIGVWKRRQPSATRTLKQHTKRIEACKQCSTRIPTSSRKRVYCNDLCRARYHNKTRPRRSP